MKSRKGGCNAAQRSDPQSDGRYATGANTYRGVPDRIQEKPPLTPAQDKGDNKNPQDPVLDPALLPTGDPAGMA